MIKGEDVDRVPLNLWGIDPSSPPTSPGWLPLYRLAVEHGLDANLWWVGKTAPTPHDPVVTRRELEDEDLYETVHSIPGAVVPLIAVTRASRSGKPGLIVKHMIETVEEAEAWLALPAPPPPDCDSYHERARQVGDSAVISVSIPPPVFSVWDMMGTELWSYWLADQRELLHRMVQKVYERATRDLRHCLAQGVGPLFCPDLPEVCAPPLCSPADFQDFVVRYDKPLIDIVHEGGRAGLGALPWRHVGGAGGLCGHGR